MAYEPVQGTHCGHVKQTDTVIRTGIMDDVRFQIFEVKHLKTGLNSLRFFPCDDPQEFLRRGCRFAKNMAITTVKNSLKRFSDLEFVVHERNNPMHQVYPWTNLWAWSDTPLLHDAATGKWKMEVTLNVPATGWSFKYSSPEVNSQGAVNSALYNQFRAHFQGCMIEWKERVDTPATQKTVASDAEDILFGG